MADQQTIDVLNRLLAVHCYSLSTFWSIAHPWSDDRGDEVAEALQHVVADEAETQQRLVAMIRDFRGRTQTGTFPMEFTSLHDLSSDYLLGELIRRQRINIDVITQCVADLATAPLAKSAAEEALGAAQAHLETFEQLATQPTA